MIQAYIIQYIMQIWLNCTFDLIMLLKSIIYQTIECFHYLLSFPDFLHLILNNFSQLKLKFQLSFLNFIHFLNHFILLFLSSLIRIISSKFILYLSILYFITVIYIKSSKFVISINYCCLKESLTIANVLFKIIIHI